MRIPKIETLVILVIFIAVGLWAMQRCSSKRADLQRRVQDFNDEREDRPARRDTVYVAPKSAPVSQDLPQIQPTSPAPGPAATATQPATTPTRSTARPTLTNPAPPPAASGSTAKGSTLYVTIDGLKVRKEPGLKGDPVAKLDLYEPVTFLNQKTEWTQESAWAPKK